MIPKKPRDRIKTNRRDAVTLARLFSAGELPSVWVPDAVHEAVHAAVDVRKIHRHFIFQGVEVELGLVPSDQLRAK
jgi:hypothetical protein